MKRTRARYKKGVFSAFAGASRPACSPPLSLSLPPSPSPKRFHFASLHNKERRVLKTKYGTDHLTNFGLGPAAGSAQDGFPVILGQSVPEIELIAVYI